MKSALLFLLACGLATAGPLNICYRMKCPIGTWCNIGYCEPIGIDNFMDVDDQTGSLPARFFQECPPDCRMPSCQCFGSRPFATTCTMDLQCPDNRKCVDGRCLAVRHLFARCTDSVECPDNRQCINGSCVVIG